jgi:glycosyltransferase involved in cell wall biosynthesis
MSDASPRVTVIIPTYNYGRYLPDAIASILAQTFRDFEIIVVDDGSTDDTPAIMAAQTDPRVRPVRKENGGTSSARNLGRTLARGEFLTFLDADDLWRPTFLERHIEVLDAEPEVAYSFANFIRTQDGKILPGTQFDLVPRLREIQTRPARAGTARVLETDPFAALAPCPELPGWLQASLFRRSTLENCWSRSGLRGAEDLYLVLQLYALGRPIAFMDDVLVEVRRHGDNSYNGSDRQRENVIRSIQAVNTDIALSPAQRAILHRRIGREYCARGWRYFWSHDIGKSAGYYVQAMRWPGTKLTALSHLALLPIVPLLPRREPEF